VLKEYHKILNSTIDHF